MAATKKALGVTSAVIAAVVGLAAGAKAISDKAAYDNRPLLSEECVMNGFGEGSCSFTNTGKTAGTLCGHIEVTHEKGQTASNEKFCSGVVQPQSTVKVDFSVPAVNSMCETTFESGKKWNEVCSFTFYS